VCFGTTCNKPIRVSSPIPFKSQLHLCHGRFAIFMAVETERFSSEETGLHMCEVKVWTIYRTSWIPLFLALAWHCTDESNVLRRMCGCHNHRFLLPFRITDSTFWKYEQHKNFYRNKYCILVT